MFDGIFEKGSLPKTLEYLELHGYYCRKFTSGVLPKNLKYLNMNDEYFEKFDEGVLPESLEILAIPNGVKKVQLFQRDVIVDI